MEIEKMGRVTTAAKIVNLEDTYDAEKGAKPLDEVRSIEINDALVDTGATMLSMPGSMIQQLGLKQHRTRHASTAGGIREFNVFGTVELIIQGRDCRVDVAELPEECPVLIGQVPLELLDFVVDPIGQQLIANPAHGGKHMIEMF